MIKDSLNDLLENKNSIVKQRIINIERNVIISMRRYVDLYVRYNLFLKLNKSIHRNNEIGRFITNPLELQ